MPASKADRAGQPAGTERPLARGVSSSPTTFLRKFATGILPPGQRREHVRVRNTDPAFAIAEFVKI